MIDKKSPYDLNSYKKSVMYKWSQRNSKENKEREILYKRLLRALNGKKIEIDTDKWMLK